MNFLNRFKRISLLLQCLVKVIFYGRANKIPSKISRIIIVPTGKLGDVVCATQVFAAIRTQRPDVHIIAAGNSKLHRPLLADSNLVDEYLDFDGENAIQRIKASNADMAIVTGPSFQAVALFYLAGIKLIVAPTPVGAIAHDNTRPYEIMERFIKTFPHEIRKYAPRERLRSLEPIGIFTDDTRKVLGFSKTADEKVTKMISDIPSHTYLIGISAGAGNKEKQWQSKNFAAVANHLIKERDAHIILIGGKNDLTESAEMMSTINDKSKITDLTGTQSLDELKAMISKLDVFISVNTGPLYMAEAFDIPTVDILGPVNAWDQPPQGEIHKMVFPPGKPEPLLCIMNTRNHDVNDAIRIAESTRPEDVIAAAEAALEEADKKIKKE